MSEFPDSEHDGQVLTESETKLEKPKLFKVLLHNDDFTTMEFVVFILKQVFMRSDMESVTIMLKVHTEGRGVCGIYPKDVASTKVEQVTAYSRQHQHPLQCAMEET